MTTESEAILSDEELSTISAYCEAATPGPWELETDEQYIPSERKHYLQQWVMNGDGKRLFDADSSDLVLIDRADEGTEYDLNAHNNLEFAAHARTGLPRVIQSHQAVTTERDALRAENEELQKRVVGLEAWAAEINVPYEDTPAKIAMRAVAKVSDLTADLEAKEAEIKQWIESLSRQIDGHITTQNQRDAALAVLAEYKVRMEEWDMTYWVKTGVRTENELYVRTCEVLTTYRKEDAP